MSSTAKNSQANPSSSSSAKSSPSRRSRRHKKMLPRSLNEVRQYALDIDRIARRLHAVADQMERQGIDALKVIPQGLETARNLLSDRVEVEFEQRLHKLLKEFTRAEEEAIE